MVAAHAFSPRTFEETDGSGFEASLIYIQNKFQNGQSHRESLSLKRKHVNFHCFMQILYYQAGLACVYFFVLLCLTSCCIWTCQYFSPGSSVYAPVLTCNFLFILCVWDWHQIHRASEKLVCFVNVFSLALALTFSPSHCTVITATSHETFTRPWLQPPKLS